MSTFPVPPTPMPADPGAPYRKDADGSLWGDGRAAGWYWQLTGQGRLELVGACLRCGHRLGAVVNTFVVAAAAGPLPAPPPAPGLVLPSSVVCECGERHRGRPADAAFQGCGAVFRGLDALEVRP